MLWYRFSFWKKKMKKIVLIVLLSLVCFNFAFSRSSRVDIDLSKMGSNMAYSMLFEIFINPENYVGKNIRIKGFFYRGYSDYIQRHFNYVMVGDAANCCQQGIEFLLSNKENIDENYPQLDTPIMVEGILSSYEFDGNTMYYLEVDEIQKI